MRAAFCIRLRVIAWLLKIGSITSPGADLDDLSRIYLIKISDKLSEKFYLYYT
jgi:hypothetical protein